jgi:hypothetical protein
VAVAESKAEATRQAWLDYLARHRKETAYVLYALSALAIVPAYLTYGRLQEYLPLFCGSILLGCIALAGGLWQLGREPRATSEPDATRVVILAIGGAAGLVVFLAGLWQAWRWSDVLTGGIEKWQGPDRWRIWACVAAVLGGLAISFGSLLLARKDVHTSPTLRRLLYGFNAGLSGMLLLAILVFLNLVLYLLQERGTIEASYDCTKTGIYTLSPHTQRVLENLQQPVTVYLIWPMQDPTFNEVVTLLNNCRALNDQFHYEVVSPDTRAVYELRDKYQFTERFGMLVVYGPPGSSSYDFIPANELYTRDRRPVPEGERGTPADRQLFKGEDALMSRLSFLTEERPASPKVVEGLKRSAQVYAILPPNEPLLNRIRTLLDQSLAANSNLRIDYLSPQADRARVEELRKRYQFAEASGLLVTYPGKADPNHEFFTPGQIFQKWVIYFTQGYGEPDLNDTEEQALDRGLANLRRRLEEASYDVRALQFSPVPEAKNSTAQREISFRVPDNAAALVIVRPTIALPPYVIAAIKEYLQPTTPGKKKGKLIVLLDVVSAPDGSMLDTGIEGILANYGVIAGKAQVMSADRNRVETVPVLPNRNSKNPIRALFGPGMLFYKVRQLDMAQGLPGPAYAIDAVAAIPMNYAWLLTDLRTRPETVSQAGMEERASPRDIPFALAITDNGSAPPGTPPPRPEPRLVVFGDATFVTNPFIHKTGGDPNYDLFFSALGWLRERPADIGIAPKERESFTLRQDVSAGALVGLPTVLMFVVILGLGAGVWVVRRR